MKYLEDFEPDSRTAALLNGAHYTRIINGDFLCNAWPSSQKSYGCLDYNSALIGFDLALAVSVKAHLMVSFVEVGVTSINAMTPDNSALFVPKIIYLGNNAPPGRKVHGALALFEMLY